MRFTSRWCTQYPVVFDRLALLAAPLALVGLLGAPAMAQERSAEPADPVLSVYRADWQSVSGKLLSLAEAIPEAAYEWRPSEEVRSVGEVVVHVAGPNVFLSRQLLGDTEGGNPLEELGEEATKEERIAALRSSIALVDRLMDEVEPSVLEGTYEAFGQEMSGYRLLHILATHAHEHLGQLIAYGRSNGVTPPWSE